MLNHPQFYNLDGISIKILTLLYWHKPWIQYDPVIITLPSFKLAIAWRYAQFQAHLYLATSITWRITPSVPNGYPTWWFVITTADGASQWLIAVTSISSVGIFHSLRFFQTWRAPKSHPLFFGAGISQPRLMHILLAEVMPCRHHSCPQRGGSRARATGIVGKSAAKLFNTIQCGAPQLWVGF